MICIFCILSLLVRLMRRILYEATNEKPGDLSFLAFGFALDLDLGLDFLFWELAGVVFCFLALNPEDFFLPEAFTVLD